MKWNTINNFVIILFQEIVSAVILPKIAYISHKSGKSNSSPKLTLVWNVFVTTTVDMLDEGDCIYTGKFVSEPSSNILATGCLGEKLSVQIRSKEFGDMLFVTEDRMVKAVEINEGDFDDDYIDYDYDTSETEEPKTSTTTTRRTTSFRPTTRNTTLKRLFTTTRRPFETTRSTNIRRTTTRRLFTTKSRPYTTTSKLFTTTRSTIIIKPFTTTKRTIIKRPFTTTRRPFTTTTRTIIKRPFTSIRTTTRRPFSTTRRTTKIKKINNGDTGSRPSGGKKVIFSEVSLTGSRPSVGGRECECLTTKGRVSTECEIRSRCRVSHRANCNDVEKIRGILYSHEACSAHG